MNRKSSVKNNPMLPPSVSQSHQVGLKTAQLDGTKSRCRLCTMIMKRSSHIPKFAESAVKKSNKGLVRTRRDQAAWGMRTFVAINSQNAQPYAGPNARLNIT